MLATSEPVFGSVIAKKPSCVPATQPGMYLRFCSAVPNFATVSEGPRFCMLNGSRHDAETLAISSAISTDSRQPIPLPPSSSGSAHEKNPSSPILATRSARNSCRLSSSANVGAISSAANRRAVSRIISCSSLKSNCIGIHSGPSRDMSFGWIETGRLGLQSASARCGHGKSRRLCLPAVRYSISMRTASPSTLSPDFTRTSVTVPATVE